MISSASGTCAATSRALHTAVASAYSPAVLPAFGRSSANDDFTTCMRPLLLSGGHLRLLFVNHRFLAAGNWTLLSIECALLCFLVFLGASVATAQHTGSSDCSAHRRCCVAQLLRGPHLDSEPQIGENLQAPR